MPFPNESKHFIIVFLGEHFIFIFFLFITTQRFEVSFNVYIIVIGV